MAYACPHSSTRLSCLRSIRTLCLLHRMNVDLPLCHTLYKQILGLPITMADVEELDGALFR